MALAGFQYDIFISYPRENRPWAREFRHRLQEVLDQLTSTSEKARIFFDDNDWGGQDSSKLVEAARHSALFVAIVLPAYVAPQKFTLKELDAFCSAHKARGSTEPPIFNVEYLPTEDRHRPPQLMTPRRYQFWTTVDHVKVPLHLTESSSPAIYELAGHIRTRLDDEANRSQDQAAGPSLGPITPYSGKFVLLGQVTDDLVGKRDELRDFLRGLGLSLLPSASYPKWGMLFRDFFSAQLRESSPILFIQLLSEVRSAKRDDEDDSCAQFQCNAALTHFRQKVPDAAGKHVIVWRSSALDVPAIKRQIDDHYDLPLLEGAQAMGLEQLKNLIKQSLDRSIKEELDTSIEASKPSGQPLIYIAASTEDRAHARDLQQIAVDRKGAATIMNGDNPGKDFREKVKHAAAVVFLYGGAQSSFVGKWLDAYLTKYRLREKPLRQRIETVYRAPPSKNPPADELDTDWHGLRKCGEYNRFNEDCMHHILNELTGGGATCPNKCRLGS